MAAQSVVKTRLSFSVSTTRSCSLRLVTIIQLALLLDCVTSLAIPTGFRFLGRRPPANLRQRRIHQCGFIQYSVPQPQADEASPEQVIRVQ